MTEWKGPWKCEKCGAIIFEPLRDFHIRTESESGGSGETGWARYSAIRCGGTLQPHDRRAPDPQVAALVKALKEAMEEGHPRGCGAVKGPGDETWLVEKDCNCWFKGARAALAEIDKERVR